VFSLTSVIKLNFPQIRLVMSDRTINLFSEIMADKGTNEKPADKVTNEESSSKDAIEKSDASTSKENCDSVRKSKSNKDRKSCNEQSSSTKKSLDKLAEIMETGFSDLMKMFSMEYEDVDGNGMDSNEFVEESDIECNEVGNNCNAVEPDIFQTISGETKFGERVGPDVHKSLACLADRFLSEKMNESETKEKCEKYLRPSNIEFLETPKINKPIWENLSLSKIPDVLLQNVQRSF